LKDEEFDRMFRDEQIHWWYRARRRITDFFLKKHLREKNDAVILDVASACGANFFNFKKYGKVIGIDISDTSISYCKSRGIADIHKGDAQNLPFESNFFDAVLALDALEHFENDSRAVSEMFRVLKPGGLLLVNTPAFMSLWSQHDTSFHHVRRYRTGQLSDLLRTNEFSLRFISYWSFFLFLPVFALRRLRDLLSGAVKVTKEPASDFGMQLSPWITFILNVQACMEFILLRAGVRFPYGVSVFAVAVKP